MARDPRQVDVVGRQGIPDAVEYDLAAFDRLIRSQGVRMEHSRAMRCPVGMKTIDDFRRSHDDHSGCSNGFLYTPVGTVMVLFSGNTKETQRTDLGFLGSAVAQATFSMSYEKASPEAPDVMPQLAPYDRLYLAEESVTVVHWQLVEASPTGLLRLQFPAVDVADLVDSSGNRYSQGNDFEVQGGAVRWTAQRRPGYDAQLQKGDVCAIRYTYRPFFYVQRMLHEVRVSQVDNPYTGQRSVVRLPQAAYLVREYIFETQQRDDGSGPSSPPGAGRQTPGPPSGGFSAR